jgi:hypothetical protein
MAKLCELLADAGCSLLHTFHLCMRCIGWVNWQQMPRQAGQNFIVEGKHYCWHAACRQPHDIMTLPALSCEKRPSFQAA